MLPVVETTVVDNGRVFTGNNLVEFFVVAGEDELGGDNGVKQGLDRLLEAPEDKRCAVDDTNTEGLWVVGLEALDKETDKAPVHVVESKIGEVKDDNNGLCCSRKDCATASHSMLQRVNKKNETGESEYNNCNGNVGRKDAKLRRVLTADMGRSNGSAPRR